MAQCWGTSPNPTAATFYLLFSFSLLGFRLFLSSEHRCVEIITQVYRKV